MKILIFGNKGWLGGLFWNYLKELGVEVISSDDNIAGIRDLQPDILESGITAIANFAASADIDWCEKHKFETFQNNVLGAINVARICKLHDLKNIFISSACILKSKDANDVKYEDDIPSPSCFYTETKLMAEKLTREICSNSIIVRLRLPISEIPHPRNVLDKLSTYKKLIDCQESVTIVEDFIPRLFELIQKDEVGTFNLINEGTISPAEIGKLAGFEFERFTKEDLDKQMSIEGRATRTSSIIGTRYKYLPLLKDRINDVINKWKSKK